MFITYKQFKTPHLLHLNNYNNLNESISSHQHMPTLPEVKLTPWAKKLNEEEDTIIS